MELKYLTLAQKQAYLDHGFLILPNFIKKSTCENLIAHAKTLMETFDPNQMKISFSSINQSHVKNKYFLDSGDKIHFFLEENALDSNGNLTKEKTFAINKIGHALHDHDKIFNEFSRQQKFALLAHDLELLNPLLVQSMYICKQPYIGGEVVFHQDATYLFSHKNSIIGLWLALEDATIDNGCLWAIPGGHKHKLKSRFKRIGDETKTEIYDHTPWEIENSIPLEVTAGTVIVLHGLLPHMSKKNKSARSRHAYTLHLMSHDAEFAKDNWLQRESFSGF